MKAEGAIAEQLKFELPVSVGIPTGEPTKILAGKPGLQTLLYDQKRDGAIRRGEALALYEDGTTERVRENDLYPAAEKAMPLASDGNASWSNGGQIYYLAGRAWGVNCELKTICLGTELDIRAAIQNPKAQSDNPVVDAVIEMERQVIKQGGEQYGRRTEGTVKLRAQKPERRSNKRIRPMRIAGRQRFNHGQSKKAKKHSLHRT